MKKQKSLKEKLTLNKVVLTNFSQNLLAQTKGGLGEALATGACGPGGGTGANYCITSSCPKSYPANCSDQA